MTEREKIKVNGNKRKKIVLIAGSVLHSIFLILVTFWLLSKNMTYGDEIFLFKWSSVVKKLVLKIDSKPPVNKLLFINVSYDNMLVDKTDEDGFVIGNTTAVDRQKLADFFGIVNDVPDSYRYILCDIFFADPSPYDEILRAQLSKAKNIIIPYHLDKNKTPILPLFNVNKGLADYNVIDNSFLKYSISKDDTIKSLPLKMFEDISGRKFRKEGFFYRLDDKMTLNNIIIDFKVRYFDIFEESSETHYPYVNLGEFLSLPDSLIKAGISDRIIVMGDFRERDIHKTILGNMPGPLILLNVFLTLSDGENIIGWNFFLILFIGYFLISLDVFSAKNILDRKYIKKLLKYKSGTFIVKFLGYVFYLGVLSVILYMIGNIHINILIIAVYLKILESVVDAFRSKDEKNIIKKIYPHGKDILKVIKSQ